MQQQNPGCPPLQHLQHSPRSCGWPFPSTPGVWRTPGVWMVVVISEPHSEQDLEGVVDLMDAESGSAAGEVVEAVAGLVRW